MKRKSKNIKFRKWTPIIIVICATIIIASTLIFSLNEIQTLYSIRKNIQYREVWEIDSKTNFICKNLLQKSSETLDSFINKSNLKTSDFFSNKGDSLLTAFSQQKKHSSLFITGHFIKEHKAISIISLCKEINKAFSAYPMSKENFIDLIYPYSNIPDFQIPEIPNSIVNLYIKYSQDIPADSLNLLFNRYDYITAFLRILSPHIKNKDCPSVYNFFFTSFPNCIIKANYNTLLLRKLGFQATTEFISAYKEFRGCHYYTAVKYKDKWYRYTSGNKCTFKEEKEWQQRIQPMNIYRFTTYIQNESPFMLKDKNEFIPTDFNTPYIADITDEIIPNTQEITLPLKEEIKTSNNLAYLASFNSGESNGFHPVNWGKINKVQNKVSFKHVIPNRLYFPIYYKSNIPHLFASPFILTNKGEIKKIQEPTLKDKTITCYLKRKFPIKQHLAKQASQYCKAEIFASTDSTFKNCNKIGHFPNTIIPYYQEVPLATQKESYQYYRIKYNNRSRKLVRLCWIPNTQEQNLSNIRKAPTPPILMPQDTVKSYIPYQIENSEFRHIYHCDENGNSYSDFYMNKPIQMKAFRFMPDNAFNGIHKGHNYQLLIWKHNQWIPFGEKQTAHFNYLSYQLYERAIYWIKDLTYGSEESPFIIKKDGEQLFI